MTTKKSNTVFILLLAIALCSFNNTNSSLTESIEIHFGGPRAIRYKSSLVPRYGLSATIPGRGRTLSEGDHRRNAFPDILINLNYPDYRTLLYDEGYKQIDDGGLNGIIVYRQDQDTFIAYEPTCTYRGKSDCITVKVDPSGLFMADPCCGSTFNFSDGYPTGGPASRPLIKYKTYYADSVIRITDEITN